MIISPSINPYNITSESLMKKALPRPARRYCKRILTDVDGSYLPVITVTVDLWERI